MMENNLKKFAIVEKQFEYNGYDCICVFTRNGFRCGYVSAEISDNYDKTKELCEFIKKCDNYKNLPSYEQTDCNQCKYSYTINCFIKCQINGEIPITRPPMSWCYVEELK